LNVTRLEKGPQTFIKKDHEIVVTGKNPIAYVILQPLYYCIVNDPVMREKDSSLIYDKHGQVKVNIGDSEIRTNFDFKEPFPLYPGETLGKIEKLPVVSRDGAIKLQAIRDFIDSEGKKRVAGDEWLEFGPKIYIPRVEV
jgi:major vault protein